MRALRLTLFCHGDARLDGAPVNLAYQVTCKKCRASGPVAKSAQEAVKAWEHWAEPRFGEPPATFADLKFEKDH